MRGYKATLSNGAIFTEDQLNWLQLKSFLKKNNLKIVDLQLVFDHQTVFCRKNSSTYFYAKKIEVWLQQEFPDTLFYGIGASDQDGTVTITWYDGQNSSEEIRKISEKDIGIWIN